MTNANADAQRDDGKIVCRIDGARVHSIQAHIQQTGLTEWTMERYAREFPEEPVLSAHGKRIIEARRAEKAKLTVVGGSASGDPAKPEIERRNLADVFGLPSDKCKNGRGEQITCAAFNLTDENLTGFIPDVDPAYVFNIDLVKTGIIGLEMDIKTYLWGYHGTGKSSLPEQLCARTGRPMMRVQHTINTEEAHIIGQWTVVDGSTEYQLGPLPQAMIQGMVYLADEYDFAMPSVTSVYQAVLEGKPLVIKDAPPHLRVIRPHKNFRFVATGNTNGGGDETGLYQGTQLQNAANYSRFGIVEEVGYMEPTLETAIVASQASCARKDAEKLVEFANKVREEFKAGRIGSTMSPREIIGVAKLGLIRGSDWRSGLRQGFLNRCSRSDKEALEQVAQRMFG